MAATQLGRVAIADAIDVFYSIGWYQVVPSLLPAFSDERLVFSSDNPAGNSGPNCP
jgi:hypothetical protein